MMKICVNSVDDEEQQKKVQLLTFDHLGSLTGLRATYNFEASREKCRSRLHSRNVGSY